MSHPTLEWKVVRAGFCHFSPAVSQALGTASGPQQALCTYLLNGGVNLLPASVVIGYSGQHFQLLLYLFV